MTKTAINTQTAPTAIGPYSTAIKNGGWVFLSGQIALPAGSDGDSDLVGEEITTQARQVFKNIAAVAEASGGGLNDIVKLTVYLTDLRNFAVVNEMMTDFFTKPYPARATVEVSALPKNALIEIDAVMLID